MPACPAPPPQADGAGLGLREGFLSDISPAVFKKQFRSWVEISSQNLKHNISELRSLISPKTKLMAVIKANAYGHGIGEIGRICAEKVDWFGVDSVDEANILRRLGIKKPILVLGYTLNSRLAELIKNNISFVAYNSETIRQCAKYTNANQKAKVHLKIETGTSRQGIPIEKIVEFAKFAKQFKNIELEGIYTHFANIEDADDTSYAKSQLQKFNTACQLLEKNGIDIPLRHTACSAAAILFPKTHFDMVRTGIALYGLWPSEKVFAKAKNKIQLKPALSWKTRIAQIKAVRRGTPIGYGLTEKVSRDSKIAILPIGYFDGYDRKLSSCGNVLIHGKKCKVLGRVCMNMIIVDVTNAPNVKPEDEAILIGSQGEEQITAEDLAKKINTINYEIVSRINPVLPRLII